MRDGTYRKGKHLYFFVYKGKQYGWCLTREGIRVAYKIMKKEEEDAERMDSR